MGKLFLTPNCLRVTRVGIISPFNISLLKKIFGEESKLGFWGFFLADRTFISCRTKFQIPEHNAQSSAILTICSLELKKKFVSGWQDILLK